MSTSQYEFDQIADQLSGLGTLTSPAELHGFLCGRLSGGARYNSADWEKSAIEFLDPSNSVNANHKDMLGQLYRQALEKMQDENLGFVLLLPDDDNELGQRLDALSQWCHGFLNGFGTSGIDKNEKLSGETSEALRDFAAFVQMDADVEDDEESEKDFHEIVEYVRVAALSVFMELAIKQQDKEPKQTTVH